MPKEPDATPRSKIGDLLAWMGVLLRWAWSIPIRGAVEEAILPKPARPWSEETLVH